MKKTKNVFTILCALGLASSALGTVTLDFQLGVAKTSGGASVATNTIGILVADNNGTGLPTAAELQGAVLTSGSTIGDSTILRVFSASDFGTNQFGFADSFSFALAGGITGAAGTAGTDLGFYWFPGVTTVGATLSSGQSYGFYRSDTTATIDGSTISFNVPSEGSSESLFALTSDLGGSLSNSTFTASSTVGAAPEPSRALLGAMGLGAFLMRRRRAA